MNSHYTSKHLQELFSVSRETIHNWAAEFAQYLGPTATPPAGAKRVFQDEDLRVFALVADYKNRGLTYADAHLALKTGQRGEIPNPNALDKLPPVVQDMIVRMRSEMDDLRQQLTQANSRADQFDGQNRLLKEQLADKEHRIEELVKQIARMEAQLDD